MSLTLLSSCWMLFTFSSFCFLSLSTQHFSSQHSILVQSIATLSLTDFLQCYWQIQVCSSLQFLQSRQLVSALLRHLVSLAISSFRYAILSSNLRFYINSQVFIYLNFELHPTCWEYAKLSCRDPLAPMSSSGVQDCLRKAASAFWERIICCIFGSRPNSAFAYRFR